MSANPDYLAVFRKDLLEGETLTQFSSCFDCGIHENLVEYRAARRIALGDPVRCWCQPFQGEVAEIKCHFGNKGAIRGRYSLKKAPTLQTRRARLPNYVSRDRVFRKKCLVHYQCAIALSSKKHGSR